METNQKKNSHLKTVSASTRQSAITHTHKSDQPAESTYELILNWYKISGKKLLDEEVLTDLPIDVLLKTLGNPIWNDIYHCWAIESRHIPTLQHYVHHQFDPDKFTYFIEAYHNN